jgi:ribosomal protein L7/L12
LADSERIAGLVESARRCRSAGLDLDDTLSELRRAGATIVESLKVVRIVEDVDLGRAKELVDASSTWADVFAANDQLRRTAIEAIEDDASG